MTALSELGWTASTRVPERQDLDDSMLLVHMVVEVVADSAHQETAEPLDL
jgi:hypothetical protein